MLIVPFYKSDICMVNFFFLYVDKCMQNTFGNPVDIATS